MFGALDQEDFLAEVGQPGNDRGEQDGLAGPVKFDFPPVTSFGEPQELTRVAS